MEEKWYDINVKDILRENLLSNGHRTVITEDKDKVVQLNNYFPGKERQ